MFNQLLKLGLFVTLGMWLKHRLRGLGCLFFSIGLSWILHGEYLSYVERSGDNEWLVWSFIIKWVVLLGSLALYYLLVERRLLSNQPEAKPPGETQAHTPANDGFDFLREKPVLDSEADKVLQSPANKVEK